MKEEKRPARVQKSWPLLFLQQTRLLTIKNVKLQTRNKMALLTQAGIGAIFLLLLLFLQYAVDANAKANENYVDTKIPSIRVAGNKVPRCIPGEAGICFSFVYAPESPVTDAVAQRIAEIGDLPGRDVAFGYRGFANSKLQDEFFFQNPNVTSIAVVFNNPQSWATPGAPFDYSLQVNLTSNCKYLKALRCDWPALDRQAAMQFAVDTALLQLHGGPTGAELSGSYSNFPHADLPIRFNVMASFGPLFLYVCVIFNFVIQLQSIVQEKQAHLKESMIQMGMLNSSYWCSWFLSNLVVSFFVVMILITTGHILGMEIFTKNDFGTYFFFFFLCLIVFTTFAFLLSTCTRRADAARSLGLLVFIATFVTCPVIVSIYFDADDAVSARVRGILQFIPAFPYFKGVRDLIKLSSGDSAQGLRWADRDKTSPFYSVEDSYGSFILVGFIFFFLTPYFELVRGNEYGQKKKPWFCCLRSYWVGGKVKSEPIDDAAYPTEEDEAQLNPDVLKESKALRDNKVDDRDIALKLTGLSKHFVTPAKFVQKGRSAPKRQPASTFKACDKLWYGVDGGQLFALLGHNGAGKSTTINMLTGLMNVTHGDATIFGHSIRTEMDEIRQLMGVCPQHDILWDQLTGREHLHLFARLKGIPSEDVDAEVSARLNDVRLTDKEADQGAATYSGGMRRRLSIAIALLGDPQIVFLDEPTTGMDPVTRRHVWDMITRAKVGRVLVLTTHSMEEADVLGDRIGIMARGRLVALGTSLHLKATLGAGFRVTMQVAPGRHEAVVSFVSAETSNLAHLVSNIEGHMTFQFPRVDHSMHAELLPTFFAKIEKHKHELGVLDFSVGMTTLEDVFINTAHKDEEEEKKRLEKEADLEQEDASNEDHKAVEMNIFKKHTESKEEPTGELESAPGEETKWGVFKRQFLALWKKNSAYQSRQRTQLLCVVFSPVFLVVVLLLLEAIIFTPRRNDALKGVDVACMTNLFKTTFATAATWQIGVKYTRPAGSSTPSFGGGSSLRNFGSPAFVDQPQYNIPIVGSADLGSLSNNPTAATKQWFSNVQWNAKAVAQCDVDYDKTLNDRNNLDLKLANDYQQALSTPSYGAAQCTDQSATDSSSSSSAPSADVLSRLTGVQQVRDACKDAASTVLVSQMGVQLLSEQLNNTRVASGVLGKLSMNTFQDALWKSVENRLKAIVLQVGNTTLGSSFAACGVPLSLSQLTLQTFCASPCLYNRTFPVLASSLAVMANLNTTSPIVLNATENLCTFLLNPDLVRGLSVVHEPNKATMDANLYQETIHRNPTDGQFYFTKFAAYDFLQADAASGKFDYIAYFNNTGAGGGAPGFESGNWVPLANLINSAVMQHYTNHSVVASIRSFPSLFSLDLLDPLGGMSILDFVVSSLLPFLFMLYFYIIVGALVYEKEQKLRAMMKMSGMSMTVYWAVNYVFFYLQYTAMMFITWVLAAIVGMRFFVIHDFGVVFTFLFVWGHALIAMSLLFSMFFSSPKTSTGFSFLLIVVFSIVGNQLMQQLIQSPDTTEGSFAALVWLPPMAMLRCMLWLALAGAYKEPITTANWWEVGEGSVPIGILWMFAEWVVMLVLVWYLENTLSVGYGVSKHPCFCLQRRYWNEVRGKLEMEIDTQDKKELQKETGLRADIAAEQDRVFDPPEKNAPVVRVMRLAKEFSRGKTKFRAVDGLTVGINSNECFGLLGHNGAGKTTTINVLAGLYKPTSGNAFVKGLSIKTDLDSIHMQMGVCCQDDILWGDLTAIEHLQFYGRLKRLEGKALDRAVVAALESVKLAKFGKRQAKAYSGGMKRRLSVACALIGSPLVTYLDEPSTGLDPASRHNLWDVIIASKGKRSLILTTHSMEEADVLCDRIGIMDFGRLQCLGTSPELKQRFGAGYTFMVTSSDRSQSSMKRLLEFMVKHWPSATMLNEPIAGTLKLEINANEVTLSECFRTVEANRDDLKITDWGITETTLEEVFLKVTSEGFLTRDRTLTNDILINPELAETERNSVVPLTPNTVARIERSVTLV